MPNREKIFPNSPNSLYNLLPSLQYFCKVILRTTSTRAHENCGAGEKDYWWQTTEV